VFRGGAAGECGEHGDEVRGRLFLLAMSVAGFATASAADVCIMDAVGADIVERNPIEIDWDSDPTALAYCGGTSTNLNFCTEPSLDSGCGGGRFDAADFNVRIDEFRLVDSILFGRIQVVDSCEEGQIVERYLVVRNIDCAFRP
jgi:hypothetical protein